MTNTIEKTCIFVLLERLRKEFLKVKESINEKKDFAFRICGTQTNICIKINYCFISILIYYLLPMKKFGGVPMT